MHRTLLSAAAIVFVLGSATAHENSPAPAMGATPTTEMMSPRAEDSASTLGYKSAMMKMMQTMPEFSGNADVDFMKQMRGHHQAAIDMAKVVLEHGKDNQTKALARKIISAQQKEIVTIDSWLKNKGAKSNAM